ncbi:MAG: hypothetical protein ACT4P8_15195 [Betaproteobacteria bacterium]
MTWFSCFKAVIFALLAINAAAFVVAGTLSEALDSVAWFVLLALFEVETTRMHWARRQPVAAAMHFIRMGATLAIGVAATGYLYDHAWLDALNAWLWIGVVVLLEFEVRKPDAVLAHRASFGAVATALYSGLVGVVVAWLWHGEWFDAYDALLWIIAFGALEMNLLNIARRAAASDESAGELRHKT